MGPLERPPLTHLLNQPMTTLQLMAALTKTGANFFPEGDAAKYVSITKKHHFVEEQMYRSMALASCGFGFQWSQWNSDVSPGKVVIRVAKGNTESDKQSPQNVCSSSNYR